MKDQQSRQHYYRVMTFPSYNSRIYIQFVYTLLYMTQASTFNKIHGKIYIDFSMESGVLPHKTLREKISKTD